MVGKIIADYMRSNKRLVVPQFGAFIRKDTDGKIVFVPFLRKDDGVLAQLVCTACGLGLDEARSAIDDYVADIKAGIATRGSFVIEGVGRLVSDSSGTYCMGDEKATILPPTDAPRPISAPAAAPQTVHGSARPAVPAEKDTPVGPRHEEPARSASATPRPTTDARAEQNIPATPSPAAQRPYAAAPAPTVPQNEQRRPAPARTDAPSSRPVPPPAPKRPSGMQRRPGPAREPGYPGPNASVPDPNRKPFPPRPSAPHGMRPTKQTPGQGGAYPREGIAKKTKTDGFILIALLVAVVALAVIVYGMFVKHGEPDIKSMLFPEQTTNTTIETDIE